MTDKAYAVPLHEQLASVPRNARLIIDDADGKGTRFIPVGRMCHEAANVLRVLVKHSQREWQGLTDEEIVENALQEVFSAAFGRGAKWAEAKLKEKNND